MQNSIITDNLSGRSPLKNTLAVSNVVLNNEADTGCRQPCCCYVVEVRI